MERRNTVAVKQPPTPIDLLGVREYLKIPEGMDHKKIRQWTEGAEIVAQYDNEASYVVVAAWLNGEGEVRNVRLLRFFEIGTSATNHHTEVSVDAEAANLWEFIKKMSALANRHWVRL